MIWNITDNRKRPHRWKRINAIIEATSHDNGLPDSDQAEEDPDPTLIDERKGISVADAIAWANAQPDAVTLFLYDEGPWGQVSGMPEAKEEVEKMTLAQLNAEMSRCVYWAERAGSSQGRKAFRDRLVWFEKMREQIHDIFRRARD